MARPGHRDRDKYEAPNPRRVHTIMSPEDLASGRKPDPWRGLEITGGVRTLSPQLWSMVHLTSLYLNDNNLQRIPPDIGRLTKLRYLDISSNKLRGLPNQIGDLILLKELLLNNNSLRTLPYEMGKLFHLQKLGLKGNALSSEYLQLYNDQGGTQKLITYLLDCLAVQQPAPRPSQRPWILMDQPVDRSKPSCMFTVMCYNVLCDKYATRQLYGYCPSWALSWEYRRHSIMEELKANSADIIALQEVETEQYHDYFLRELQAEGYDGIFSPKSRSKTMSESERKYVDGCAIFYRTSKFSLIAEHLIEFNQLAMANAEGSDDMLNRVMTKDNIALAALLQIKEGAFDSFQTSGTGSNVVGGGLNSTSGIPSANNQNTTGMSGTTQQQPHQQRLLVCTAHIYWDPEFCDVKIVQTIMLTQELQAIADAAALDLINSSTNPNKQLLNNGCATNSDVDSNNGNSTDSIDGEMMASKSDSMKIDLYQQKPNGQLGAEMIPLILCGDFNSLPESSVVEFLNNGSISDDHKDFKKKAYKDCLRKICNSRLSALANSQHSQHHQSHQYSTSQSSKLSSLSTQASSSLDNDKSSGSIDSLPNTSNGNGGNNPQNKNVYSNTSMSTLTNSAMNNSESNNYTHPFPIATAYTGEGAMPFTNYTYVNFTNFRAI